MGEGSYDLADCVLDHTRWMFVPFDQGDTLCDLRALSWGSPCLKNESVLVWTLWYMSNRTNVELHTSYFESIGFITLSLCHEPWRNQLLDTSCVQMLVMIVIDVWLYHKFVHPWHEYVIIALCANPQSLRSMFSYVFPWVLLGSDSRTNPFEEGENDMILLAIPHFKTCI